MTTDEERARRLATALRLAPHPEGGRYRQLHRSGAVVRAAESGVDRAALTDLPAEAEGLRALAPELAALV